MWPCTLSLGNSLQEMGTKKETMKNKNKIYCTQYIIWFSHSFLFNLNFVIPLGLGFKIWAWALAKKDFHTRISQREAQWAGLNHLITLCTQA